MSAQRDFEKEHGDYVMLGDDFCFQDGAFLGQGQFGAMEDAWTEENPSTGITSQHVRRTLKRRLYFSQTKLGRAIRTFEEMKKDLETRAKDAAAGLAIPPSQDEVDKLYELKVEIQRFEENVNAVELEINPPRPVVEVHINLEQREKSKVVLEQIKAIEV